MGHRRIAMLVSVVSAGTRGIPLFQASLAKELARLDQSHGYLLFNYLWRDFQRQKGRIFIPNAPNFRLEVRRWPQALIDPLVFELDWPLFWPVLAARGVSLFHSTTLFTPRLPGIKTVTTVHDLIIERFPEWGAVRQGARLVPRWLARADRLAAISTSTKRDLVEIHKVDPDKIAVIPLGVDPERFHPPRPGDDPGRALARSKLPARYVFTTGPIEARRNVETTLRALAEVARQPRFADLGLVVSGSDSGPGAALKALADELGLADRLILTGHVDDDELTALYQRACVFAYPALYAGFDLPPLEALACGAPVVAADNSALPELLEGCATLIPARDHRALARAIVELLDDEGLRQARREAGFKRAAQLTWRQTAQRYLALYEDVLGETTP